jgi:hypothetical protein
VIRAARPGGVHGRQGGQALLVLVALLGALALACLTLFDTGQLAIQRMRLATAADAAALAAGITEARALNFAASMNRAVVANEAAIAQSVTLRAWSQHMQNTLRNVDALTRWLPYLGAVTTTLQRFWSGYDRLLQPSLAGAEAAFALAIPALAGAERLLLEGRGIAAADAARRALAANAADARLSAGGEWLLAQAVAESRAFTEVRDGARRARQRTVIVDSLDPFVRVRNRRITPPVVGVLARFERRGGTELLGFEQWRAVDTLSFHTRSGLFGRWRERVPVGWGGAAQGARSAVRGGFGATARVNPRATRLAEAALRPLSTYRGVASLHDLRRLDPDAASERRWSVRIVQRHASLPLGERVLDVRRAIAPDGRSVALRPALAGDGLYASSSAQVRYLRLERRRDGRGERPSLYNPFWRARLVAMPVADATIARAIDRTPDPVAGVVP